MKGAARRVGIANLAPHDLRRYADSRTMPNRQCCSLARKGLDTTRLGIVPTLCVLPIEGRTRCAGPRLSEHDSSTLRSNLDGQPALTAWAERRKVRLTTGGGWSGSCRVLLPPGYAASLCTYISVKGDSIGCDPRRRVLIRHSPGVGIATVSPRRRRTGADSVSARARLGADDRAVSRPAETAQRSERRHRSGGGVIGGLGPQPDFRITSGQTRGVSTKSIRKRYDVRRYSVHEFVRGLPVIRRLSYSAHSRRAVVPMDRRSKGSRSDSRGPRKSWTVRCATRACPGRAAFEV